MANAFSVPFLIYGGNTEVTFHSLLMEPREKDIKSCDGCGSFPLFFFFSIFFGTECDDDENGTRLFEQLPTRWLLCERHPTFQFDLMIVCMEIKC